MKLIADLSKYYLKIENAINNDYIISCNVRTVKAGTRKKSQVIRSIPDGLPYDPAPFPKGTWKITAVEWNTDGKKFDPWEYGSVKIRTDAYRMVKVWELDKDGDYLRETDKEVKDSGYLLHYSESSTTLGCIRMASDPDAVELGRIIENALNKGEQVELEVV